ncbi:MAG: hypothetical protein J6M93_05505 [Succinivibrio sp.]|nr:hypothetical protein [Succinivibrio sp.]
MYGGYVEYSDGSANNNKVVLENVTVGGSLSGGNVAGIGSANNNSLILKGVNKETIGNMFGGTVYEGTADGNTVTIEDSTINSQLFGGAVISDGTANNNTVVLKSGTFANDIVGGFVLGDGTASNNTVILQGGTVKAAVKGGVATTAINNKFHIYGTADLSAAKLYGNDSGTDITGNTIYFGTEDQKTAWTPVTYSIAEVHNFEKTVFNAAKWGQTITVNTLDNHSG